LIDRRIERRRRNVGICNLEGIGIEGGICRKNGKHKEIVYIKGQAQQNNRV